MFLLVTQLFNNLSIYSIYVWKKWSCHIFQTRQDDFQKFEKFKKENAWQHLKIILEIWQY